MLKRWLIAAAFLLCAFAHGSQYAVLGDNIVYGPTGPGNAYAAYNGPFCRGTLLPGTGYTQSLSVTPNQFPNQTIIAWSWPNNTPSCTLWGYNHVDYGNYEGLGSYPITAKQLSAITTLTETFNWSISGPPADFDVINDIWLWPSSTQTTATAEVEIFLHSPLTVQNFINGSNQIGTYTDSCGTTWQVAYSTPPLDLLFAPVGYADVSTGCVNVHAMLNYLVAQGQISSSLWYTGHSLGVEPYQGAGSLSPASFSVAYN